MKLSSFDEFRLANLQTQFSYRLDEVQAADHLGHVLKEYKYFAEIEAAMSPHDTHAILRFIEQSQDLFNYHELLHKKCRENDKGLVYRVFKHQLCPLLHPLLKDLAEIADLTLVDVRVGRHIHLHPAASSDTDVIDKLLRENCISFTKISPTLAAVIEAI